MGLGPARKGLTRRHAQRCPAALRAWQRVVRSTSNLAQGPLWGLSFALLEFFCLATIQCFLLPCVSALNSFVLALRKEHQ
jgi:hypothetical protein